MPFVRLVGESVRRFAVPEPVGGRLDAKIAPSRPVLVHDGRRFQEHVLFQVGVQRPWVLENHPYLAGEADADEFVKQGEKPGAFMVLVEHVVENPFGVPCPVVTLPKREPHLGNA